MLKKARVKDAKMGEGGSYHSYPRSHECNEAIIAFIADSVKITSSVIPIYEQKLIEETR